LYLAKYESRQRYTDGYERKIMKHLIFISKKIYHFFEEIALFFRKNEKKP